MVLAIGLMSGTSLDGVDAALVEIEGIDESTKTSLIHFLTLPFDNDVLKKIKKSMSLKESDVATINSLNFELGYIFSNAAKTVCAEAGIKIDTVSFLASHGLTLYHNPTKTDEYYESTFQIGEASVISEETGLTVISDFRTRDIAVGGQGAPIVPFTDYLQFKDKVRYRIIQNIGGIGNATLIPPNALKSEVVAFDTGPGNMIINEMCEIFFDEPYDTDGIYASQGVVNEELLNHLLAHPYFKREVPKTTGREEFGIELVNSVIRSFKLSPLDFISTATKFTADSIAIGVKPFISGETDLIIGGGGSYNRTLLNMIRKALPGVNVLIQEDLGQSSEAKEAIAMTILGNQTLNRKPSNLPSATGAKKGTILGKVTYY